MLKNLPILCLLFLSACTFSLQKDELSIIDLESSGMGFQQNRTMATITNSARIVFKDDMELYITPSMRLNLEYIKDKDGKIIDEKVKSIDSTFHAYIKRKNQIKGVEYLWRTDDSGKGKVFAADSLWETFAFYDNGLENFSKDIGSPVKVIEKGNIRIEKYFLKFKIGEVDSIYRFYDKGIKDIPYSFSPKLDKSSDSKLFKIFAVCNEIPKGMALPDIAVPRRQFYHEMKVVTVKDPQKYLDIFKKFEEDSKRLKLR